MKLSVPDFSLILLVGPSGAGKSTFARRHFQPTEILSSDFFRGLVCDEESNQEASKHAFEVLHLIAAKRLAARRLTVIDATNILAPSRQPLRELAQRYHCPLVAIVFDLPENLCHEHNQRRPLRQVGSPVVHMHHEQLREALAALSHEGFAPTYTLSSPEEVAAVEMERLPSASVHGQPAG
jgi:protein phosphatase